MPDPDGHILVVGLGGLGAAMATALDAQGWQVLAIDRDRRAVEAATEAGIAAFAADATDLQHLLQTGAEDSAAAVVCTGRSIGAGILVTHLLSELGVPHIWSVAATAMHGRILQRVGARRVLYPDADAANRYAIEFTRTTGDALRVAAEQLVTTTAAPRSLIGARHLQWTLLHRYGVNLLALVTATGELIVADDTRRLGPDEMLVVGGDERAIQRLQVMTTPTDRHEPPV